MSQYLWYGITAAALLSFALPVFSADKAQIKGSTDLELPRNKTFERKSRSESLETPTPGGFVVPPRTQTPTSTDKRLLDLLDRKKNWIYLDPYKDQFDEKARDFFGEDKEDSTELKWTGEERKGVLQKFVQGEDKNSPQRMDGQEKPSAESGFLNHEKGREEELKKQKGEQERLHDPFNGFVLRENFGRPAFLDSNNKLFSEGRGVGQRKELQFDRFTEKREVSGFEKESLVRQTEAREAEFDKMIQPRSSGPAFTFNGPDLLNSHVDTTRQEINPIAPRRYDPAQYGNSRAAFFGENSLAAPRAQFPTSRGYEEFAPRAAKAPIVIPEPTRSATPSSASSGPRPFVFDIPKRAF